MYIHIYQLNAEFYIIFWKKKIKISEHGHIIIINNLRPKQN